MREFFEMMPPSVPTWALFLEVIDTPPDFLKVKAMPVVAFAMQRPEGGGEDMWPVCLMLDWDGQFVIPENDEGFWSYTHCANWRDDEEALESFNNRCVEERIKRTTGAKYDLPSRRQS